LFINRFQHRAHMVGVIAQAAEQRRVGATTWQLVDDARPTPGLRQPVDDVIPHPAAAKPAST
jgi:hypothetical protein